MPKVRNVPKKPSCYGDKVIFRPHLSLCKDCQYYFPCSSATLFRVEDPPSRKEMEDKMAKSGLPLSDAIRAILFYFDEVSVNAVKLSFSRKLKKYGHT